MQKNKLGGKAIDSGTYGCVFIPSLKCKNKKSRTNGVSKLMLNKHAINEIESLKQLYQLMNAYPNMNKYMIIPKQELCNPDYLTPKDLIHFNSTCNKLYNYVSDFKVGGRNCRHPLWARHLYLAERGTDSDSLDAQSRIYS